MTRRTVKARIEWLALLGAAFVATPAPAGENPADYEAARVMPQAADLRACLPCHSSEKEKPKLVDWTRTCDASCLRCHKDMEKHHPVGPEVEENDKVPLPLLGNNKVACISCHDLKTVSSDRRSWKAQSLFARLFQGQAIYKTYFLRINNSEGRLCKACH